MIANHPRYHRISWRPVITGTCDVDDGTSSGTVDLATDIAATHWGWDSTAWEVAATTTSIQGKFAKLVDAITGQGSTQAEYTWPAGDHAPPLTEYTLGTGSPGEIGLTFSSVAAAAQFGFDGVGPHTTTSGAITADFQCCGSWAPRTRTARDERWEGNPNVAVAEDINGDSRKLNVWGATLTDRALRFPTVLVADIRSDAAETATLAAMGGRDVSDPNNLLEQLLEFARTPENTDDVPTLRVYTAAATYRAAYLLRGLPELQALCSDRSGRQWWAVEFVLRDGG